jgi:hypothetical protein
MGERQGKYITDETNGNGANGGAILRHTMAAIMKQMNPNEAPWREKQIRLDY